MAINDKVLYGALEIIACVVKNMFWGIGKLLLSRIGDCGGIFYTSSCHTKHGGYPTVGGYVLN